VDRWAQLTGQTGKPSFSEAQPIARRLPLLSLQTQSESAISVIKSLEGRKN